MACAVKCVEETDIFVEAGGASGVNFCNAFSLGADGNQCLLGVKNHGVNKEVATTDQSLVPGGTFGIPGRGNVASLQLAWSSFTWQKNLVT